MLLRAKCLRIQTKNWMWVLFWVPFYLLKLLFVIHDPFLSQLLLLLHLTPLFIFCSTPHLFFKKYTFQCLPTCVCQKLVWTLEFSPQLRTNTKTTKICEIWIENKLMDEKCMWTCASIANQVYASQGTDPDLCPQIERENAQVTGGTATKLDYKLLEFSSSSSISLRSNPKRTPTKTKTSTAKTTTTRTIPSFAPPTEYYTSMKDSVDVHKWMGRWMNMSKRSKTSRSLY